MFEGRKYLDVCDLEATSEGLELGGTLREEIAVRHCECGIDAAQQIRRRPCHDSASIEHAEMVADGPLLADIAEHLPSSGPNGK